MSLAKYASPAERAIAIKLVDDALSQGLLVSVSDGEEWTVKRSSDRETILGALASTSDDSLAFRFADGTPLGTVWLVWGNGCDLISDSAPAFAPGLDALMSGAQELAERLALEG